MVHDQVPANWRLFPLSQISEVRFSNVDKKSMEGEAGVLLCNYLDVYNNDYISRDLDFMEATATDAEIARFRVQSGDVIITKDSETPDDIGIPAVVIQEISNLICGYHLALIKPNRNHVDSTFLAKQIGQDRIQRYFSRLANGMTRFGLTASVIENTPIWLAPIFEQHKIAKILSTIDELIQKTHSLIAKYNAIKQGMMQDLFSRGIDESGKLRPSYEEEPLLYQNTLAGPLPKCWSIELLGTICSWYSGGTPNKSNPAFWNGSIPWISPKDMKVFEIESGQDFITDEAAQNGSKVVGPGTVLIVVRGMILAHSFPVAITARKVAFNQDMKALVCEGPVRGRFLAHWLVAHASKILSKATEATHGTKRFDSSDLYNIPFPVPSNGEQEKIIQLLDNLDDLELAERNNLQKLQFIKSGLMQDLLTGKVRVKVDEPTESAQDVGVPQS